MSFEHTLSVDTSRLSNDEEFEESIDAPHVSLVFFGPCGCGKSTAAGHLIADSGAIDKQSLDRIAAEASREGKGDRRYSWILDKLQCERDRGGSMHAALWRLASRRCRFTIVDAPGHSDFAKDIVTAMSQADIAVLVVTAVQADLCVDGACGGFIREHTLLAYTLGLRQLVVCVNKMDNDDVAYSQYAFERACGIIENDLRSVGWKTHDIYSDVHFVPTSGLVGDNILDRSVNMPWYCGPTLVEALDDAVASHFKPVRPLRLLLRDIMQIGGAGVVAVGRVETGSLRPDTKLVFVPGHVQAHVQSIEMHHENLDEAMCGDTVNILVDVAMKDLRCGMVGSSEDDCPALQCDSFLAQVIVLSLPRCGEITKGLELCVECHAVIVPCTFEELLSRTDRQTGNILETQPTSLRAGEAAVVRLRPTPPHAICVEKFVDYPPLGRFVVRDQKTMVAVGVVQHVDFSTEQAAMVKPTMLRTSAKKGRSYAKCEKKLLTKLAPSTSTASADYSGEECLVMRLEPREKPRLLAKAKEKQSPSPYVQTSATDDSGEDLPAFNPAQSGAARRPPLKPSPFAPGASPFAAFGAVARK